jgi:hypothetical protein
MRVRFLALFLFFNLNLNAIEVSDKFQNIFIEELELYTRIGFKYSYKDNLKKEDPQKEQQYLFFGEYQVFYFYSVFIGVPYTIRWIEGSDNRKYIDHLRIINKFQFDKIYYKFLLGLIVDLPRNHEKAGDVPKNMGYIEPYIGIYFYFLPFNIKFSVHWNTQTNTKFIEERDQQFERKWIYNFSFGIVHKNLKFWLETQYQNLYDPKENKKNCFFIGPSFGYEWKNLNFAVFYLITSNDDKFNKQFKFQIQKIF